MNTKQAWKKFYFYYRLVKRGNSKYESLDQEMQFVNQSPFYPMGSANFSVFCDGENHYLNFNPNFVGNLKYWQGVFIT